MRNGGNAIILTFLYQEKEVTGGLASARHFSVTFSPSARVITRLGSSLDRCTDTTGSSAEACVCGCGIKGRRAKKKEEKIVHIATMQLKS